MAGDYRAEVEGGDKVPPSAMMLERVVNWKRMERSPGPMIWRRKIDDADLSSRVVELEANWTRGWRRE